MYVFSGTQVIAEYAPSAAPTAPSKEYIYLGSRLLAHLGSAGNPTYHFGDHLSARIYRSASGGSVGTQGHLPFGESWYTTGTVDEWKFTSYERDSDTNVDYAGIRFDSGRLGRFTSPDPTANSISPADPQSWNRYSYVGNDPCNAVDPMGLATCTFYIKVNNKAGLSDSQLAELEGRINAVFGSAQSDGNSVQAQFSGTGKPDFQLNISPKSGMLGGEGYSGWPASSPVIYWGAMSDFQNAAIYGGTAAAHEIVHRGAGPRFDLWGKYNGTPNLMNVNQAQGAGLGQQVINDWSNPNVAAGFASLSPAQVQKLFTKCTKKHGTVPTSNSLDDISLAGWGDRFYWFDMLFTSSDDASVSTSWDPNNYQLLPP